MAVLTKARDGVIESLKSMKQAQDSSSNELLEKLKAENAKLQGKLQEQVRTAESWTNKKKEWSARNG